MPESSGDPSSPVPAGTFFLVVGPSGVGKDSLLDGARKLLAGDPRYVFATRAITRPEDAGGEVHLGLSEEAFAEQHAAGQFLLTWDAHGLRYGLPKTLAQDIAAGRHVVANGSRATIAQLAARVPRLLVLNVTADLAAREQRIAGRGRERGSAIASRLERSVQLQIPKGVKLATVPNDGSLDEGIRLFMAALDAAGSIMTAMQQSSLAPARQDSLHAKIGGAELDQSAYERVLRDIVQGRYADREVASFLIATTRNLSDAEVIALARVRSTFVPRINWHAPIVVDKHSMGGIPGNRITMIVVPIVAAHGFLIPKTSSRAITSPAGTADAMETLAKVDLTADEVRRAVGSAGACIAWNGRLNHSRLDDVMNAITLPLGIDAKRWSVASILSKKLSAGSTHVIIDLPWGPQAKLRSQQEAIDLGRLFETVGSALGLVVSTRITDGSAPIGRGVGPALEARDVLQVLGNDAAAPHDLTAKALTFAGIILAWDPRLGNEAAGRERAAELLRSGAARDRLEQIIQAQGPRSAPVLPAALTHTVLSPFSGRVRRIDIARVSAVARAAGAPLDPGAGVGLASGVGDTLRAGDPLYTIHAGAASALDIAALIAATSCGFQ
jgi:thymidine phosphorylase